MQLTAGRLLANPHSRSMRENLPKKEPKPNRIGSHALCRRMVLRFASLLLVLGSSGYLSGYLRAQSPSDAHDQGSNSAAASDVAPIRILRFGPPQTQEAPVPAASNTGTVSYWGGPLISNVHVVEVMWGFFVDGPSTTGLEQFFTDVTNSNYFDLLSEYGTIGLTGRDGNPGSNQSIGRGVFDNKFTITPSLCPGSAANPPTICSIDDTQIQTELLSQLNAGHLPAPVLDSQGNLNTLYLIYFPPGVRITVQGAHSCQFFGFCAYHNDTTGGSPKLPYGVFPDFGPTSGCSAANGGCGSETSFQNLTTASSHEFSEAVTDVIPGSGPTAGRPNAWVSSGGEEIGDFCAGNQVQITANGNTYTVQKEWSNMQNGCVSVPAHFQLAAQANANPGKPFGITVTALGSLNGNPLTAYSNTVHFTSSDGLAVSPADYTFVPGTDAGVHAFSITLNTKGNQSITVADTLVSGMIATVTVAVNDSPDLTVTSSHAGNFTQGQTGATYTVTAANVGNLATDGSLVTVSDTLPFGLTPAAISGTGWTCSLPALSCARSDALAANASYPPITVTVNVDDTATTPLLNTVQVSGGGDPIPQNNIATDSTVVIQLADLTITKTHLGDFSQGQIGETYTLTVSNGGRGPTIGTVSVTDTLPTGLTATAMSGAGWTCTVSGTPACMRSDVLAPASSYPAITLTVSIANSAPLGFVTNTATVSGGGEVITGNDMAFDQTLITVSVPDLTITSSHSGGFTQGQNGATFILNVSNAGPQPTNGQVTVTDSPGVNLATISISGTGWTCVLLSFPTCTRSDALAANSSYPPITVVNYVSVIAPASGVNVATVSGGGGLDSGETFNDPYTVTQLADLIVRFPNAFTIPVAGTSKALDLAVTNAGKGATTGTVTVTDTISAGATITGISGPGWNCTLSTATCTRNDVLAPNYYEYPPISVVASYALSFNPVVQTATVSGGGEVNTTNDTASLTITPLAPVQIVPSSTAPVTITAGSAAAFVFNFSDPAQATATFSCSNLPPGSACSFSPASNAGQSNSVTMTVSTTGPRAASASPFFGRGPTPFYAILLPAAGLIATAARRKRRGKLRLGAFRRGAFLGFAALLALALLSLIACGGSHPPPVVPTPPGTYMITATATDSAVNYQNSAQVTLIVN